MELPKYIVMKVDCEPKSTTVTITDISDRCDVIEYEAEQTEPQLTQKCPFDDSLPCEWVCTEYGKCKYKPQTERSE